MNLRNILKKLTHPFLKLIYHKYKLKKRTFSYQGVKIDVLPSVFHPGLFLGSKYLLKYVNSHLSSPSLKVLELGAGSGLISVFMAKKGYELYASDINPEAVRNVALNAKKHDLLIQTYLSDLFDDIPKQIFDVVLINPPYYPKTATNNEQKAWFCGENFEYFIKLFSQISQFIGAESQVLMVLIEECDLERINQLANNENLVLIEKTSQVILGEKNIIFQLVNDNELSINN